MVLPIMVLPMGQPSAAGITLKSDGLWIGSNPLGGEHRLAWVDPSISWDFTSDERVPLAVTEFLDDEDIAVLVGVTTPILCPG